MPNNEPIVNVKVDKVDRIILAELDKNCRANLMQIAKTANKSRQSVEYRINQLQKMGVITGFHASFNPHKMGAKLHKIYLKLKNIPKEKKRLLNYLNQLRGIYWKGECSGNWDLIVAVFVRSDYEFFELKNNLITEFNGIILEEEDQPFLDARQYPKMYFTGKLEDYITFGGDIIDNKLDALDYILIQKLVANAKTPLTELAQKLDSTIPTIKSRLEKLQKIGVITQYRISVDLNKLGLELYKAILHLNKYDKEDERKLFAFFSNLKNTHYFIRNMDSIEIELAAHNYLEFNSIIENLKEEFPLTIQRADFVLMKTDEWAPGLKELLSK